MGNSSASIACSNCGHVFGNYELASAQPRIPCTVCLSTSRAYAQHTSDSVEFHDQLAYKARHAGDKKPFLEGKCGESQSADGTWATIEQVVDRDNDRYRKKVTDARGNVIRDVDEPLAGHRGYGSAKRKPPTG